MWQVWQEKDKTLSAWIADITALFSAVNGYHLFHYFFPCLAFYFFFLLVIIYYSVEAAKEEKYTLLIVPKIWGFVHDNLLTWSSMNVLTARTWLWPTLRFHNNKKFYSYLLFVPVNLFLRQTLKYLLKTLFLTFSVFLHLL